MVVTILFHLPRNHALATIDPGSPDAAGHWTRYEEGMDGLEPCPDRGGAARGGC